MNANFAEPEDRMAPQDDQRERLLAFIQSSLGITPETVAAGHIRPGNSEELTDAILSSDVWRERGQDVRSRAHRDGFIRGWYSARAHADIAAATHSPDFRAHWCEPAANDDSEDAIIPIPPGHERLSIWDPVGQMQTEWRPVTYGSWREVE